MPLPSVTGRLRLLYRHPRYLEHLLLTKWRSQVRYRWAERNVDADDQVSPPLGYKIVLTYKCNLRCTMCYQWGDVGWCHEEPKSATAQELDWQVLEKLFSEVAHTHPYFIFIGGEPTLYSRYPDLAELVKRHHCFSITCTNGMSLDRLSAVTEGNPYLTFLVSLDGLEKENDRLRGRGVYKRVTANLQRLRNLKEPPYVGVEFTIRPENVAVMYDFCREMAEIGVDWVIFNPCWFISEAQARAYEQFMRLHFKVEPKTHLGYVMPYGLDKEMFIAQMNKINASKWPMQISSLLENPEDIYTYVDQPETPPGNTFCYRQWARMDITPEGQVSPCILYPDLILGDLKKDHALRIWNSDEFKNFRQIRRKEVLPICAKCNGIYLHDAKRKHL